MDRGPLSESDADALETWLHEDLRRLGALMRARALFVRTESAWPLESVFEPAAFAPPPPELSRRRMLATGGIAAAMVGALGIGYGLTASTAYATARGELRQVPLTDGSRLTLNTLSAVRIGVYYGVHDIRLETGEMLLTLAGTQKPDYSLRVGDWRLQAASGIFFVSHLPNRPPEITVHRGRINVAGPGSTKGLRLEQACRLILAPMAGLAGRIETLSSEQLARELAWLNGQLTFHDESLADAVQAFARYSERPIILRDPTLIRQTITGIYASNDPAGFAQTIGTAFGVRIRIERDRILIG